MAFAHAVGITLVGVFHAFLASAQEGTIVFHVAGAAVAIVGGNAAIFVAGSELVGPSHYFARTYSRLLPLLGVATLFILLAAQNSGRPILVPDGVWERLSVYTILLWQLIAGSALLRRNPATNTSSGAARS